GPLDFTGSSLVGPQSAEHPAHDPAEEENRPRLIRQVQTDPQQQGRLGLRGAAGMFHTTVATPFLRLYPFATLASLFHRLLHAPTRIPGPRRSLGARALEAEPIAPRSSGRV